MSREPRIHARARRADAAPPSAARPPAAGRAGADVPAAASWSSGPSLDRRSFLRLVGFSFGAVGVAGCSRGPVQTALAYLAPPDGLVPGRIYEIASTCWADGSGSGLLVRCRDGRPIKLEGNPGHPLNRGGLSAVAQASILSLYDQHRLDGPLLDGRPASWAEADAAVAARIAAARAGGGKVRLLTSTLTGPSTLAWIEAFLSRFADGRHVMYDALSCSALLDAQAATRGVRALPRYDLSRARVLACFDADPLGTWISPAGFAADHAAARRPDGDEEDAAATSGEGSSGAGSPGADPSGAATPPAPPLPPRMSRHWQFEARLSLTGTRADRRVRLAPWETAPALALLGGALARRVGVEPPGPLPPDAALAPAVRAAVDELADELARHRGESLVLCGRNDRDAQVLTCWINALLDSHGLDGDGRGRDARADAAPPADLAAPSLQRRGDDRALLALRDELRAGEVELLIVAGANPAYELPGFAEALGRAAGLVSLAPLADETSALARVVCPEPHELERWDDGEPLAGLFTTTQPTVPELRSTRTLRASLARWSGDGREDRELLADHWRRRLAPRREAGAAPFEAWFAQVLERGWTRLPSDHAASPGRLRTGPVAESLARVAAGGAPPPADALGLVLYPKVALLDGRGAHNPWLQELPDPVSKVAWDNHADVSPATAARLGLATGDVVGLQADDGTRLELPVLVQPGQDDRVVAVALGYGRRGTDRFTRVGPQWLQGRLTVAAGGTVGSNAAPLIGWGAGGLAYDGRAVRLSRTGGRHELACTQDHHSLSVPAHLAPRGHETRDAVATVGFPALLADPAGALRAAHVPPAELWPDDHASSGPRWGMVVDLAACTGCAACVVGCQAENNVPVVGRDEERRHREMSWLRIDRYYAEHADGGVETSHQPMMCQHCGHAPCETVCPVLATVHGSEGLNAQVYNRCVGTRYCANNCPYKVRRFNWFEYARDDRMQNLALNPDVTIRSRGVMEKCSMCVQRIQAGKAAARRRGTPLVDGEVRTACQQSCPTRAITFGDLADPASAVSRRAAGRRAYAVLAELNVQPSVRYLADVRNVEGRVGAGRAGGPSHG